MDDRGMLRAPLGEHIELLRYLPANGGQRRKPWGPKHIISGCWPEYDPACLNLALMSIYTYIW